MKIVAFVICSVSMIVAGVFVRFIVPLLVRHWGELERLQRCLGVICVVLYVVAVVLLAGLVAA